MFTTEPLKEPFLSSFESISHIFLRPRLAYAFSIVRGWNGLKANFKFNVAIRLRFLMFL